MSRSTDARAAVTIERERIARGGDALEWIEPDGLGGFASGTASGIRTRRYHALLLAATTPPAGRMVLVNGFEAWLDLPGGPFALSSQRYGAGLVYPDGASRIASFSLDPWPTWHYEIPGGLTLVQEILVPRGVPAVLVAWRLAAPCDAATLEVRPLVSGRDHHALHHENGGFRFASDRTADGVVWRPYPGVPGILSRQTGTFDERPDWYRGFVYSEEEARGLDAAEDLATPGVLRFDLSRGEALWMLADADADTTRDLAAAPLEEKARALRVVERGRRAIPPAGEGVAATLGARLRGVVDDYLAARGAGRTILAGYPWFLDWGRDTFIAVRGLCLATGRLDEARAILLAWAGSVSEGMLPNRFPDRGDAPEFNSVDASLWYVIAVHDWLDRARRAGVAVAPDEAGTLRAAVTAILEGYSAGTRFGIRVDPADGLLAAGTPGVQLTWMDAKVGDWVVTPRIGKPVEVQALWLNALAAASTFDERWGEAHRRGLASFRERFWNAGRDCLFDVVDADHVPGRCDPALRPNQIFAVGGLPLGLLDPERARRVVDVVEANLATPLGLRSLAPGEPGYVGRYAGGVRERDGAYHQGTVWPWLIGPFVEAWVRVRGGTEQAKREAASRFLAPLAAHLEDAGLGHVSEIADADPPHTPRGCPFQAWSVGEALRLAEDVLR